MLGLTPSSVLTCCIESETPAPKFGSAIVLSYLYQSKASPFRMEGLAELARLPYPAGGGVAGGTVGAAGCSVGSGSHGNLPDPTSSDALTFSSI